MRRPGGATAPDRSARMLECALVFSFIAHGTAMLGMALLLLPAMPGAAEASDAARARYVASHSFLFRLGWFPWQVTALSDLLIALGLVRTTWIPKAPAMLTALLTVAAVIPDQMGQVAWMTRGVALAEAGDLARYIAYEARVFRWTAVWGGTFYTLAALGWTACFAMAGAWCAWLTTLSIVVWSLFGYVNAGPFLSESLRPSDTFVAAGNAAGFVLLEVWLALASEQVLRRNRPESRYGRWAPWRHPNRTVGPVLDAVANSRFARALVEWLPPLAMVSDIKDVVYVNYIVNAECLAPLVPEGLELQRIGPGGRFGVFTFLTFRHGHFGPRFLGPLRFLLGSPIQANFRIHVRHPGTGTTGIHFVTTAIASTVYAFGARFMAEAMPMHVLAGADLRADRGKSILELAPGDGSAPDAHAELHSVEGVPESGPWSVAFASFRDMLAYVVPQDRALSTQPEKGFLTRQEIELGIPLDSCEPLLGSVESRFASAIASEAQPFCFRVPSVRFRFDAESRQPLEARFQSDARP